MAVMLLDSTHKLYEIKAIRSNNFLHWARLNKVWTFQHRHESLKLKTIGIITKTHHMLHWRPTVIEKIGEAIQRQLVREGKTATPPSFDLLKTTTKERIPVPNDEWQTVTAKKDKADKFRTIECVVFEVQCDSVNAEDLDRVLLTINNTNRYFQYVPFGLRSADKQAYVKKICEHGKWLNDVRKITVTGIHSTVMDDLRDDGSTLRDDIEDFEVDGNPVVYSVEETNGSEDEGRWHVLCDVTSVDAVDQFLRNNLTTMYRRGLAFEEVPETWAAVNRPRVVGNRNMYNVMAATSNSQPPDKSGQIPSRSEPKRARTVICCIPGQPQVERTYRTATTWAAAAAGAVTRTATTLSTINKPVANPSAAPTLVELTFPQRKQIAEALEKADAAQKSVAAKATEIGTMTTLTKSNFEQISLLLKKDAEREAEAKQVRAKLVTFTENIEFLSSSVTTIGQRQNDMADNISQLTSQMSTNNMLLKQFMESSKFDYHSVLRDANSHLQQTGPESPKTSTGRHES